MNISLYVLNLIISLFFLFFSCKKFYKTRFKYGLTLSVYFLGLSLLYLLFICQLSLGSDKVLFIKNSGRIKVTKIFTPELNQKLHDKIIRDSIQVKRFNDSIFYWSKYSESLCYKTTVVTISNSSYQHFENDMLNDVFSKTEKKITYSLSDFESAIVYNDVLLNMLNILIGFTGLIIFIYLTISDNLIKVKNYVIIVVSSYIFLLYYLYFVFANIIDYQSNASIYKSISGVVSGLSLGLISGRLDSINYELVLFKKINKLIIVFLLYLYAAIQPLYQNLSTFLLLYAAFGKILLGILILDGNYEKYFTELKRIHNKPDENRKRKKLLRYFDPYNPMI